MPSRLNGLSPSELAVGSCHHSHVMLRGGDRFFCKFQLFEFQFRDFQLCPFQCEFQLCDFQLKISVVDDSEVEEPEQKVSESRTWQ